MKQTTIGNSLKLWLSARDTDRWATRPTASWPCSHLRGKRLFAEFDRGDLVDVVINGRSSDCPADEFNAITRDHAPGYFAAQGR